MDISKTPKVYETLKNQLCKATQFMEVKHVAMQQEILPPGVLFLMQGPGPGPWGFLFEWFGEGAGILNQQAHFMTLTEVPSVHLGHSKMASCSRPGASSPGQLPRALVCATIPSHTCPSGLSPALCSVTAGQALTLPLPGAHDIGLDYLPHWFHSGRHCA